jgi:zinc transport system permease protein
MFGSVLTITDRDLLLVLVLGSLVGVAVAIGYNVLLSDSLSPPIAKARGAPTTAIDYGFVVVITIAITVSLKIIGALLVEAMIVVPAATARNLARSTKGYLAWSIAIAIVAGLGGLFVSTMWRVPSGGAIVLALSVCFFISLPIGRWVIRK